MASLEQRLTAFAQRMRDQYNNKIRPRLIPPGGDTNFTLIKANGVDYQLGWAAPPSSHFCNVRYDPSAPNTPNGTTGGISNGVGTFKRFYFTIKDRDTENLFDLNSSLYTVPETGLYLVNAYMRLPDSMGNTYFGFGVDVTETDTDNFLWTARFGGPTQWGQQFARMMWLTAGQQLRMYGYNVIFVPSRCVLSIAKLDRPF